MEGQTDRKGLEMPCVALHAVARYNKLHRNFRNKVVYDYDKNRKICCMIKSWLWSENITVYLKAQIRKIAV